MVGKEVPDVYELWSGDDGASELPSSSRNTSIDCCGCVSGAVTARGANPEHARDGRHAEQGVVEDRELRVHKL